MRSVPFHYALPNLIMEKLGLGAKMRLSVTAHGAVSALNTNALVGVMDLDAVQTDTGVLLFAATRGDSWKAPTSKFARPAVAATTCFWLGWMTRCCKQSK
jgi:hypothetical protein